MSYFLQAKKEKDYSKILGIQNSSKFQPSNKSSTYKSSCKHTLAEIDRFTMEFEDEHALKNYLLAEGILPVDFFDSQLIIRFLKKNNQKVREYNLLYRDDMEYFYVPNSLIDLVHERYKSNDFKFLNELARYFYHFGECSATALEVVNLTELAMTTGEIDKGFYEIDSNGDDVLARLVKLLMYKYKLQNGDVIYSNEFNWRTFHILIDFIKKYSRNEENMKAQTMDEVQEQSATHNKRVLERENPVQANGQIPEQLTINDWMNK